MNRFRLSVFGIVFLALGFFVACGSDEQPLSLAGAWRLNGTVGSNSCNIPASSPLPAREVTISQDGERFTIRVHEPDGSDTVMQGTLDGADVAIQTFSKSANACPGGTETYTGGGSATEQAINLEFTVTIGCSGGSCSVRLSLLLTRI